MIASIRAGVDDQIHQVLLEPAQEVALGVDLHREVGDDRLVGALAQGLGPVAQPLHERRDRGVRPLHAPDVLHRDVAPERGGLDLVVLESGGPLPGDPPLVGDRVASLLHGPAVGAGDHQHPRVDVEPVLDLRVHHGDQRAPAGDPDLAIHEETEMPFEVAVTLLVDARHHGAPEIHGNPVRLAMGHGCHDPLSFRLRP